MIATAVNAGDLSVIYDTYHLVDEVNAPVKDHSATVDLLSSPVAGDPARALNSRFYREYLTELALLIKVTHNDVICVPTAVLMSCKKLSVFFRCGDHFFKIGRIKCYRLFRNDIFACLHSLNGEGLVVIVRCCYRDKLYARVAEKLLERRVGVNPPRFCKLAP